MRQRAGQQNGGGPAGIPDRTAADENPGNQALHDMRAQLAALHGSMWGRRN